MSVQAGVQEPMSEFEEQVKARLADRYTSAELAEWLEIPVYDLLENYYHLIPDWMFKEVGVK